MRLDDGEQVAAIERLIDPEDAGDIAEAAPVEVPEELADGDTERVDMTDVEGEGEGDDDDDDDADDAADDEAPPDDE
jgi:hypothetical protein